MGAPLNIDRRNFIVTAVAVGGGMTLMVAAGPSAAQAAQAAAKDAAPTGPEMSAWISIAPDDAVLVRAPIPEIGNGALTQCAMTVAEELECGWSNIRAEVASANRNYMENDVYSKAAGSLGFFAGRSTGDRFKGLLQAGASARERLKAAAAQTWKVPVAEIDAKDSVLTHRPTGRTLRFGEVAARAATIVLDKEPALKDRSQWTLLGKASPGKLNNAAIANGSAIYGMDIRQPNMLYAALMQSPVQGGRLKSYDFEAIRHMPGIHSVVVIDPSEPRPKAPFTAPLPMGAALAAQSGLAVVADHYWQARKGLEALPIVWDDGPGAQWKTTEQMHDAAIKACESPGKVSLKTGDAPAQLAIKDGTFVEGTYLTPFCDHSAIEPLNGTALVTADRVDLWHPSQHSQQAFFIAVEESGVAPGNVFVHQTYVGGGFGRRVFGDDVRMVVAVARKIPGRPVHVIWQREEVMRQGRYRGLQAVKWTAKLDADGMPRAVLARTGGAGYGVGALAGSAYAGSIPHLQVESTEVTPMHIMTGPYRGPSYNSNAFFVEGFIDECAAAAKMDPLQYRLKLLSKWGDPAWAACLNEAATKAGWGAALPRGQGRGIAISNWGGQGPRTGTTVAAVARVEVTPRGRLKVHQIDVAFDSGSTVNHDAVLSQMQGGTMFGMNMTLNEGLTIKDGRIVEGNFDEYPMLKLADAPDIRVHFGGLSGADRFSETGEPPVGPVGPAIINAIYAATGKRIRQTPLRKQDLKWT